MNWLLRISQNLAALPEFIAEYEGRLEKAKATISTRGRIETLMAELPSYTEMVFGELQTVEAVLRDLEIRLRRVRSGVFKRFLEGYNRALSSRDAEKYVDGDSEVIDMELLINEVAYLRNRYLGVIKALESKNFMLGHISKIRVAGLDNAMI